MQTETRKRHPSGIFPEDDAAQMRNPIGRAMDKEAVQMFATPAECILKDFVEFGDTGCADHEKSPPHQWTDAAEHHAKLINRKLAVPSDEIEPEDALREVIKLAK
jgi:hypothetical protein